MSIVLNKFLPYILLYQTLTGWDIAFNVLTLLVGRQEEHTACKNE